MPKPASEQQPPAGTSNGVAATGSEAAAKSDGLQTLDRALSILNLFQPDREEWSAAEAAEELGLGLGTVSRFMRGLAVRGFLTRSGRRYRLGFAGLELGHRALSSLNLRNQLRHITVRLARDSGETCLLLESSGGIGHVRVIDRAEPSTPVRISVDHGLLLPITSGLGRVMIAHLPEDYALVFGRPIEPELARELVEIRDRGWALSRGEEGVGTWAISAPVVTPAGVALGAIALIAPDARHTPEAEARLVQLLLEACEDAKRVLGFSAVADPGDD